MNGYHNFNNHDFRIPKNNINVEFLKRNEVKSFTQVAFLSKLCTHGKLDFHRSKFKRKYLNRGLMTFDSKTIFGKEKQSNPNIYKLTTNCNGEINLVTF